MPSPANPPQELRENVNAVKYSITILELISRSDTNPISAHAMRHNQTFDNGFSFHGIHQVQTCSIYPQTYEFINFLSEGV